MAELVDQAGHLGLQQIVAAEHWASSPKAFVGSWKNIGLKYELSKSGKSWAWVPGRATEKLKSRDMDKMTQKAQKKWQKGWDQERVAPTGAPIRGEKQPSEKLRKLQK